MNELLASAKAVIEATDTGDRWCAIANLSAAVERAERQKAVRLSDDEIRELFLSNGFTIKDGCSDLKPYVFQAARAIEFAAQQAERERILEIIYDNRDVFMEGGLCLIVEKIDDL